MPLEPRFRREAASRRPFVNREGGQRAFNEELERVGRGPRVLNFTGVGGIGKSRMMTELQDHVGGAYRNALLDLQVPATQEQDAALAVLRTQLGAQGVRFDRYDIAYAVLWQRLHPHLRISGRELPLVEHSEILTEILDGAAGIPVFGTVVGLSRLLERASARMRRWRSVREDATLRELDTLPNGELIDAVTFLFAEDLRAATPAGEPYVLFVDAYESLVQGHARVGQAAARDVWLRDLVVQADRGLVVVASRESLRWEVHDEEWAEVIRVFPLDDLPMDSRLGLLDMSGFDDATERLEIAEASEGVPFYLHLAVDIRQRFADRQISRAVSPEEILQRFLQHVRPEEVKILELLSAARTFDFEIFQALGDAYELPKHRMAWDSIVTYSFVYAKAAGQFQLHQLMATTLRARLSPDVDRGVHRTVRNVWDGRADTPAGDRAASHAVVALREAAHHALHAGDIAGSQLLAYADRLAACGGNRALGGLLADVQALTSEQEEDASADLADAALCLETEAAILAGDAEQAAALVQGVSLRPATPVQARTAVAAAHAHRILGRTTEGFDIYRALWATYAGPERLVAGLWAADLHMAQGRFAEAVRLVAQLRDACPDENNELLGDAVRLLHLTYRFAFDFDSAIRYLDEAVTYYRRADTVVGLANIQTNRAEQLALTDPVAAVGEAEQAIEMQHELGAMHELGKAYTAMGVAHVSLGEYERAEAALASACDALERARYRSGRARAEFFRAAMFARCGDVERAVSSVRWTVSELEATEVYPSLILAAAAMLNRLGRDDGQVTAAAGRAATRIQPLDSLASLEKRIGDSVVRLMEARP